MSMNVSHEKLEVYLDYGSEGWIVGCQLLRPRLASRIESWMNVQLSPVSNSLCFCEKIVPPACPHTQIRSAAEAAPLDPVFRVSFPSEVPSPSPQSFCLPSSIPSPSQYTYLGARERCIGKVRILVQKPVRIRGRGHVSYRIRIRVHWG